MFFSSSHRGYLNVNRTKDATHVRDKLPNILDQSSGFYTCHHPRKRMIQYAAAYRLYLTFTEYWMPAFAGVTAFVPPSPFPCLA
jgi:hypothetical protein